MLFDLNLVGKIVVELEEFVALRNAKSADEAKLFIFRNTNSKAYDKREKIAKI